MSTLSRPPENPPTSSPFALSTITVGKPVTRYFLQRATFCSISSGLMLWLRGKSTSTGTNLSLA